MAVVVRVRKMDKENTGPMGVGVIKVTKKRTSPTTNKVMTVNKGRANLKTSRVVEVIKTHLISMMQDTLERPYVMMQ